MDELIARAQAGDPDALGELWRTYHHLLLRYFRGKGMNDPDDLAQTVWTEVASSLGRFKGDEEDFRRWLFTIATRRRIDDIRASKRRSEVVQKSELSAVGSSPDAATDADRAMSLERALDLLRDLPPDQAEAVLLRVVADLGVSDVAEIMGRAEGSVRVLVHRGLKRLGELADVTETNVETMSST